MPHTKGPWHVTGDLKVAVQSGPIGALAYVSVAEARGRRLDEAQANARLISAAPELLDACREARMILTQLGGGGKLMHQLQAAIGKATSDE